MSVVAAEGFGHFTSLADWSAKGNNASGGSVTFAPTGGRGNRGICTIGGTSNVRKVLSASKQTLFCHYYFYIPSRTKTQIGGFRNATNDNVIIEAMEDGSIRASRADSLFGVNAFSEFGLVQIGVSEPAIWFGATFHHIQVKCTISSTVGEVTVKIDGAEILSITNANTYSGGGAISTTQFGWSGNFGNSTASYGDLFICDTSGSLYNTYQGDVAVYESVLPVDGDELQWTRSTGAGTWSSHVDQNPQTGDAIYLRSLANGDRNCFSFPAVSSSSIGAILVVKETVCHRKEDASYGAVKLYSRQVDNVDHDGPAKVAAQDYTFVERIYEQDLSDNTNWTDTKVNNTQLGFVNVS